MPSKKYQRKKGAVKGKGRKTKTTTKKGKR